MKGQDCSYCYLQENRDERVGLLVLLPAGEQKGGTTSTATFKGIEMKGRDCSTVTCGRTDGRMGLQYCYLQENRDGREGLKLPLPAGEQMKWQDCSYCNMQENRDERAGLQLLLAAVEQR
ncbi:hypothetical protein ACOMHN_016103 [Nucella lapillus]